VSRLTRQLNFYHPPTLYVNIKNQISGAKLNFLAVVLEVLGIPFFQCAKLRLHFTLQDSTDLIEGFAREALDGFLKTSSML
jgi:hypothetical protein